MAFEVYKGYRKRFVNELYVTLHPRGIISINRGAYEELGQLPCAGLQFDKDERLLGIFKTSQDATHAIPVHKQGHSDTYLIAATPFMRMYKIDTTVPTQYKAIVNKEGILIVDLKEAGIDVSHSRRPREHKKAMMQGSDTVPLSNNEAVQDEQVLSFQEACDVLLSQVRQQKPDERKRNLTKIFTEFLSILKEE